MASGGGTRGDSGADARRTYGIDPQHLLRFLDTLQRLAANDPSQIQERAWISEMRRLIESGSRVTLEGLVKEATGHRELGLTLDFTGFDSDVVSRALGMAVPYSVLEHHNMTDYLGEGQPGYTPVGHEGSVGSADPVGQPPEPITFPEPGHPGSADPVGDQTFVERGRVQDIVSDRVGNTWGFPGVGTHTGDYDAPDSQTSVVGRDTSGSEAGELPGERNTPHGYELWRVDGYAFVVYFVPGTQPPIPMAWSLREDQLQAIIGPDALIVGVDWNEDLTGDQFKKMGGLFFGNRDEIVEHEKHPFDGWLRRYELEAEIRPWIRDPEFMALYAQAALEGRNTLTDQELMTTEWWRTHTPAERAWLKLNAQDPSQAQRVIEDARIAVKESLEALGVLNPPDDLINFLVGKGTTGEWSSDYLTEQMNKLADPRANAMLDPELQDFTAGLDTTQQGEDRVRQLLVEWLGPSWANGWNEEYFQRWAGMIRNDPDAEIRLVEELKRQRLAMYPEYENPELSYQDIAAPWRDFYMRMWGQLPDETDPFFGNIIRLNDQNEASKVLTREGLKRGVGQVVFNTLSDLAASENSQVGVRNPDRGIL